MKRLCAIILILMLLCGCAMADVITVDTETATVEEIEAVIEVLQKALKEKKGEKEPEMYTFSNGMSVGVVKAVKTGSLVTVTYLFSHQDANPASFAWNIVDKVFQNGVEIQSEWTRENYESSNRSVLRDTVIEVTWSYVPVDDSPLTIFLRPLLLMNNDQYSVTVEIQ